MDYGISWSSLLQKGPFKKFGILILFKTRKEENN